MASTKNNLVPQKFKGQKSVAKRWLDQFSRNSENQELSERAMINDFFSLLEDAAYDYCASLPDDIKENWEDLEKAFKDKLCKKRTASEAEQELLETKQSRNESLVDSIDRVQNIGLREKIQQNLIFSAIMARMKSELKPKVAQKNPSSLFELEEMAQQADTVAKMQAKNIEEKLESLNDQDALAAKVVNMIKPLLQSMSINAVDTGERQSRYRRNSQSQEREPRKRSVTPHRKVNFSNQSSNGFRNTQEQEGNRKPRSPGASCGELHFRNSCRYRNATCYNCNKPGHISKVCRSAKYQVQPAHYSNQLISVPAQPVLGMSLISNFIDLINRYFFRFDSIRYTVTCSLGLINYLVAAFGVEFCRFLSHR